jgi:bifunctional DNA-binding transcriptional regulator/antitoxin component of YhaV-PrlF toxin-antitoxin module
MSKSGAKTFVSKLSIKSPSVLPREVKEYLRIGPGDQLRDILDAGVIRIEKASPPEDDNPFVTFSEWASVADDEAYGDL